MVIGIAIGMVTMGLWITLIVGLKPEWFCHRDREKEGDREEPPPRTPPMTDRPRVQQARERADIQTDINVVLDTLLKADEIIEWYRRQTNGTRALAVIHAMEAMKRLGHEAASTLDLADRVSALETALRTLRQWDMLDVCDDGPWAKRLIDAVLARNNIEK